MTVCEVDVPPLFLFLSRARSISVAFYTHHTTVYYVDMVGVRRLPKGGMGVKDGGGGVLVIMCAMDTEGGR